MISSYRFFKRLYHALFITIGLVLIGIFGYRYLEDYSFLDSFYMTIITITTVGYMEVKPLSDAGRIFTSVLIILSFGTLAYAVSSITSYLAGGEILKYRRSILSTKKILKMENHVIICGYGRVGKKAVEELLASGKKVVVIEKLGQSRLSEDANLIFLDGDATTDQVLLNAGILKASAVITALPKDTDNLFVVLSARELNSKIKIVSRCSDQNNVSKLKTAGATGVVMPDTVGGSHMASVLISPDVIEFVDLIKISGKSEMNLEEIRFDQVSDEFKNCSIKDLKIKSQSGCNVIGYKNSDGEYCVNPDENTVLSKGTKLFVLGNSEQINKLNKYIGI